MQECPVNDLSTRLSVATALALGGAASAHAAAVDPCDSAAVASPPASIPASAASAPRTAVVCPPSNTVEPVYPKDALDQGIEGRVVLRVSIDRQGAIESVVVRSSPHPLLTAAAEAAVRQWKFRAPVVNGQALKTRADVPFVFKIEE
jgi:TonB family protein